MYDNVAIIAPLVVYRVYRGIVRFRGTPESLLRTQLIKDPPTDPSRKGRKGYAPTANS